VPARGRHLLWPLLLLGCSLAQTAHVATAQATPSAAACSNAIGAPVISTRSMPMSWMVATESEELIPNGSTRVLTRTELQMDVAFTPVACKSSGVKMLLSINSVMCKVKRRMRLLHVQNAAVFPTCMLDGSCVSCWHTSATLRTLHTPTSSFSTCAC
jgi:hypothetical protein